MVTAKHTPKQLGQMLLEQGLLTQQQLEIALRQHRNTPKSLGRTLIDLGYIRERDLVRALAKQVGLDFVDLRVHHIDPVAAALVPDQLARRYRALPIGERDGKLLVAMSDPANLYALDDIRAVTSREVQPVVATASDVEDAIDKFAGTSFRDLRAVSHEAEGTAPNAVPSNPDEPTAVLHARAAYAGVESQTRTSLPSDPSIKQLVNATWILAGTTVSLIFVTIVLIFITART
jgi:CBS domain-containing protein